MHQQWLDLPEADPIAVALVEWAHFSVGVIEGRGGAAEEFEHGQVDLAMAAVGSRIDQPGRAFAPVDISGPEVSVDAGRWFDRSGQIGGPVGDLLDHLAVGGPQTPGLECLPGKIPQPRGVDFREPGVGRSGGKGYGDFAETDHVAGRTWRELIEPIGPGTVNESQPAPQRCFVARSSGFDPFQDQSWFDLVLDHAGHCWHFQAPGLAKPFEPGRLVRKLGYRPARPALPEKDFPVSCLDPPATVDVSAGNLTDGIDFCVQSETS